MVTNVAIDVGGTFTDFVIMTDDSSIQSFKLPSTPSPELAVLEGLKRINMSLGEICHATTIASNLFSGQIGLRLPNVALLTTTGFRDLIDIGRQNRPELYDLSFTKPRVLVPEHLRFEIDERTEFNSNIVRSVSEVEINNLVENMLKEEIDAVAVCLLHSYANPHNENKVRDMLSKNFNYVSVSNEISPEPREYERTTTTIVNALLMPVISKYIESLGSNLHEFGNPALHIMSSSGGLIDVNEARTRPVQLVESGPAAGVIATAEISKNLDLENLISFDMGGTTAKMGAIVNSLPEIVSEYEVAGYTHHGRVAKGSGYPVRFPFVDLAEVSAGGGTIIWKDEAGALHVGPVGAGSEPGPACYGKGGTEPTVTDSNLLLGRINDKLLAGAMMLSRDTALNALSKLGEPYHIADSAVKLANLEMARAIRLVTTERGQDPSDFTIVAFGGAGPQHAASVAKEMDIKKVIIPLEPGVFSSLGMLMADSKFEARASHPKNIEKGFQTIEEKLVSKLGREAIFLRYADLRYSGQGWEITVPATRPASIDSLKKDFEEKHKATHGFTLDTSIEVVTIRIFALLQRKKPEFKDPVSDKNAAEPIAEIRMYFDGWYRAPIYRRDQLPMGFSAEGPIVIEEYGSTTVAPPEWSVRVDRFGIIVMEK